MFEDLIIKAPDTKYLLISINYFIIGVSNVKEKPTKYLQYIMQSIHSIHSFFVQLPY